MKYVSFRLLVILIFQEKGILQFEYNSSINSSAVANVQGISNCVMWNMIHQSQLFRFGFNRSKCSLRQWFIDKINNNHDFQTKVLSTDKATFTQKGWILSPNTKNIHLKTAHENLHSIHPHTFQHWFSITVSAGLLVYKLMG